MHDARCTNSCIAEGLMKWMALSGSSKRATSTHPSGLVELVVSSTRLTRLPKVESTDTIAGHCYSPVKIGHEGNLDSLLSPFATENSSINQTNLSALQYAPSSRLEMGRSSILSTSMSPSSHISATPSVERPEPTSSIYQHPAPKLSAIDLSGYRYSATCTPWMEVASNSGAVASYLLGTSISPPSYMSATPWLERPSASIASLEATTSPRSTGITRPARPGSRLEMRRSSILGTSMSPPSPASFSSGWGPSSEARRLPAGGSGQRRRQIQPHFRYAFG